MNSKKIRQSFIKFFEKKDNKAFVPFFTIGDPSLTDSYKIVSAAIKAGADAILIHSSKDNANEILKFKSFKPYFNTFR